MLWLASIRGKFDLEGGERETERQRERESVCVCVCVLCIRRGRERESVCVSCASIMCLYVCMHVGKGVGDCFPCLQVTVCTLFIYLNSMLVCMCVCFQIYAITGNLWGMYGAR